MCVFCVRVRVFCVCVCVNTHNVYVCACVRAMVTVFKLILSHTRYLAQYEGVCEHAYRVRVCVRAIVTVFKRILSHKRYLAQYEGHRHASSTKGPCLLLALNLARPRCWGLLSWKNAIFGCRTWCSPIVVRRNNILLRDCTVCRVYILWRLCKECGDLSAAYIVKPSALAVSVCGLMVVQHVHLLWYVVIIFYYGVEYYHSNTYAYTRTRRHGQMHTLPLGNTSKKLLGLVLSGSWHIRGTSLTLAV